MKDKNFSHLIGVPYEEKDCWELSKSFYKDVLNISLTNYSGDIPKERWEKRSLISSCKGDFIETKSPKFGDLITIAIHGVECHIAVYLENGLMLHTSIGTGSVIERIARWNKLITGYYTIERNN